MAKSPNEQSTKESWALSSRRGWLMADSHEQHLDWQQECFSHGRDCIVVSRKEQQELRLTCFVHPSHQLSDIAYMELTELFKLWEVSSGSMGSWRGDASEFGLVIPCTASLDDIVADVQEILRRDRAPRRRVERNHQGAPVEGLAIAVDCDGLWEGHAPTDRVYVLEMDGRPGRCLVFKHLCPPLVDMPLSAFRILSEVDA